MMFRFNGLTTAVGISALLLAVAANAILIDFTDETVWGGVEDEVSYSTVDSGVTIGLSTAGTGTLTFNGYEGPGTLGLSNGGVLQGDGDGIGIRNIGDTDELNANDQFTEYLYVDLGDNFYVTEIFILDLFTNEVAAYGFNGDSDSYQALSHVSGGFHEIDVVITGSTTSLSFWVNPPGPGDDGDNDYALAGLRIAYVQEPASLTLMVLALILMWQYRRK